jgi:hypothetical protein
MPGWTSPKPKTTRPVKVTIVFSTEAYNDLAAFVAYWNADQPQSMKITLPDTVRHAVDYYLKEAADAKSD